MKIDEIFDFCFFSNFFLSETKPHFFDHFLLCPRILSILADLANFGEIGHFGRKCRKMAILAI